MAADAGFAWSAISDLATPHSRKLVDLDQVSTNHIRKFCVTPQELLESAIAREAYNQLDKYEKLRIHELRLRPCGFTMAAGLGDSAQRCDARLNGNRVDELVENGSTETP